MRKSVLVLASMVLMVLLVGGVAWAVTTIMCEPGQAVCRGTAGNDAIYGTMYQDTIKAGSGIDTVDPLEGKNVVYGGNDIDSIYGGSGVDEVYGGNQDDKINSRDGKDRLYGGDGNDKIATGQRCGVWNCWPDQDIDYVNCGAGRDTVYLEKNTDRVKDCEALRRVDSLNAPLR